MVDRLAPWQRELIQKLCSKKGIIKFCIFKKDEIDSFWVIAKEVSTEFVLECSKEYCDILNKYPDINCDFMVYGKDEICGGMLPPDAIVINGYY